MPFITLWQTTLSLFTPFWIVAKTLDGSRSALIKSEQGAGVNECSAGCALIIELKSVKKIDSIHEAQILTYMKLSGIRTGLIFNFNVTKQKTG
jgi:hypothetical protein